MKFCSNCENMLYVSLRTNETGDKLVYCCRQCGLIDENTNEETIVLHNQLKHKEQTFHHIVNKYTKFDPTLPRIKNIPCPNPECSHKNSSNSNSSSSTTVSDHSNEVIYLRYDDENLKYLYICPTCDHIWKTHQ